MGAIAVLAGGIFFAVSGGKKKVDPTPIPIEVTATPTPEPIATPIPASLIPKDISVGDIITFGRYEQDNDLTNGAEPIEWNVLNVRDGKALLISRYGLDEKVYDEKFGAVTWENCMLKKWLNNGFMKSAFTPEEASRIQTTIVTADVNPNYNTDPGNDTKDQVFLLSIKEAQKYFENNKVRMCAPTKYAIAQGAYESMITKTMDDEATCWWWLRSPGEHEGMVAGGLCDGSVSYFGNTVCYNTICVRPALCINLAS